jgi:hypothetical protein
MLWFVPLFGWGLYRRVRRTFGRQPIRRWRMGIRAGALSLAGTWLLATAPGANAFEAAAAGGALGVTLAFLGLAHTRFETTDEGRFYTPNGWIGLVVTALFLGRLAVRALGAPAAAVATAVPSPLGGAPGNPLTAGAFFLMAAYYVCYDLGVLRRSR